MPPRRSGSSGVRGVRPRSRARSIRSCTWRIDLRADGVDADGRRRSRSRRARRRARARRACRAGSAWRRARSRSRPGSNAKGCSCAIQPVTRGCRRVVQARGHVEVARARPAAQPLHRAAGGEVHVPGRDVDGHRARGLVEVGHHQRAHLVRALDDGGARPARTRCGRSRGRAGTSSVSSSMAARKRSRGTVMPSSLGTVTTRAPRARCASYTYITDGKFRSS